MKKAVIWGIGGQDGSYLGELLLKKDYEIVGVVRRSSTNNTCRISHLLDNSNFSIIEGDIVDPSSVHEITTKHQPDEIYNLAAMSHVGTSFKQPSFTFQVNAVGVLNILESVRLFSPQTKLYQAGTSEEFGNNSSSDDDEYETWETTDGSKGQLLKRKGLSRYQDENTQLAPTSPYAVSKVAARHLCQTYRNAYQVFVCCNWLMNHESPRRGENFVTRKITKWIGDFVRWKKEVVDDSGLEWNPIYDDNYIYAFKNDDISYPKLRLGNLNAKRDWGYAADYCESMWLTLQQNRPDDFVIATGETHSIKEFLIAAFSLIQIYDWGSYVVVDPEFYRPSDVEYLCGRADKAREVLGWKSTTSFKELVEMMVKHDIGNNYEISNKLATSSS